MRHWALRFMTVFALAVPIGAQASPDLVRSLGDVLQMDQTLSIMSREAISNAEEVAPDLFGGATPTEWSAAVTVLFDPATSRAAFDAAMLPAASGAIPDHLSQAVAFFQAPFGQRLIDLELSAREALLDKGIEDAAKQSWADLLASPMPASAQRADLIREVVAAGNLIDANVSAALNGNLAFYQGLADAGALPAEMTADDMLTLVREQETEIRAETEDWLYSYLAMAYSPVNDEDLRVYRDFMKSSAGQALNGVLLRAFDQMSADQSRGMGLAAGLLMAGQDI